MPSTTWLFKQLQKDFPRFTFQKADGFWWSARDQTIYLDTTSEHYEHFTLHELSHALLDHTGYKYDVELIKLERDAWHYAATDLGPRYHITIDEAIVQDNLDTYRDWLHARSTCPDCKTIGIQTKQQHYHCLGCGHSWRANEARICALRRYALQTK